MAHQYEYDEMCSLCNTNSDIPHSLRTSMIRIANLCCIQEDILIKATLKDMKGVDSIVVNVVGKYAIVKHCAIECCAPTELILQKLNDKRLGASVRNVDAEESKKEEQMTVYDRLLAIDLEVFQSVIVFILFILGVVLQFSSKSSEFVLMSSVAYMVAIGLGILPITFSCIQTLVQYRTIDIKILMILASAGSIALDDYLDSALVVTLFLIAGVAEKYIKLYVSDAVAATNGGIPRMATLLDSTNVLVSSLKVGDVLLVRTGDIVAADGIVIEGSGTVDESSLTGEAVPLVKSLKDLVYSGSILQSGYVHVRVTVEPEESSMQKINMAVQEMQADRGEFARIVDQFASYWAPTAITVAILLVLIPVVFLKLDTNDWLHRSLIVLVLACPCALVISSTIPAICAIACAARNGVLIKGSSVVEKMVDVNAIALDKTGTLTKGQFKVMSTWNFRPDDADKSLGGSPGKEMEDPDGEWEDLSESFDAMECAVALEEKSTHPLAACVIESYLGCIAEAQDKSLPTVKNFKVLEGVGLEGWVDINTGTTKQNKTEEYVAKVRKCMDANPKLKWSRYLNQKLCEDFHPVIVGNKKLLKAYGGKLRCSKQELSQFEQFCRDNRGSVILLVAIDDELHQAMALADELRADAGAAIELFKHTLCLDNISMITGDSESVALKVATELSIGQYHAELLPSEKLEFVQYFQKQICYYTDCFGSHSGSGFSAFGKQLMNMVYTPIPTGDGSIDLKVHAPSTSSQGWRSVKSVSVEENKHIENTVAVVDVELGLSLGTDGNEMQGLMPLSSHNDSDSCWSKPVYNKVMMIGDGINDAMALAAAHIGVAIGASGTAIAATAGDIVIMNDNLAFIAVTMQLCNFARAVIIENCVFAVGIKFVAVGLAITGHLELWAAIAIDLGSLLVVIANGLRCLNYEEYDKHRSV